MKEFSIHIMRYLINFSVKMEVFPFTRDGDVRL